MGIITDEIKQVIDSQKLCFVASVCPDNTPNLSPKGTLRVLDDNHLIFANIRSPQTIINLKKNPTLEINVVDPMTRKGFRFKGNADIIFEGENFKKIVSDYQNGGVKSKIKSLVLVTVKTVNEITSPLYDLGYSVEEIKTKWKNHYLSL